ncbi:pirin family protein [Rheinheimera texasensis]|uniref:pirin family protein n=1 Tax=Rheinheimera texasensis TaxID=306205 RepID=UPI0032B10094
MIELRKSSQRGSADFGWLQSRHSFSFGRYYDPAQMGFSALRVINDDRVTPGAGFDTHGHRDMEIISLVLDGVIAHRDSTGQVAELPAGEYQLMSAGRGIMHSEFNARAKQNLHFLQIWIEPDSLGGEPGYQQKPFAQTPGLTLIASKDGAAGSLLLKQDAKLFQLRLDAQTSLNYQTQAGRKLYLHLVTGSLSGQSGEQHISLQPGDGVKIADLTDWQFSSGAEPVFALLFDLP